MSTQQSDPEKPPTEETRAMSCEIARLLEKKKTEDITVLEVFHYLPVCDFFIIATGRNAQHLSALRKHLEDFMEEEQPEIELRGVEGYEEGLWLLMDYGKIVIHLFQEHVRDYYRIENLWADAPEVEWNDMQE